MIAPISSIMAAPLRPITVMPAGCQCMECAPQRVLAAPAQPVAPVAPAPAISVKPAAEPGSSLVAQEGPTTETVPNDEDEAPADASSASSDTELTQEEQAQVAKLKARDREVRAHEQAHAAAGGAQAGAPSYSYQQGPDGRQYAVGGEVPIKASASSSDPQAAIRQLEQVVRAALAPAQPSGQDRAVAAGAQAQIAQLRAQAAKESRAESQEALAGATGGSEGESAKGPGGASAGKPLLPALPKFDGASGGGEAGNGSTAGATLGKPFAAYQQAGGDSRKSGALLSLLA